jgi:hypothetical protein
MPDAWCPSAAPASVGMSQQANLPPQMWSRKWNSLPSDGVHGLPIEDASANLKHIHTSSSTARRHQQHLGHWVLYSHVGLNNCTAENATPKCKRCYDEFEPSIQYFTTAVDGKAPDSFLASGECPMIAYTFAVGRIINMNHNAITVVEHQKGVGDCALLGWVLRAFLERCCNGRRYDRKAPSRDVVDYSVIMGNVWDMQVLRNWTCFDGKDCSSKASRLLFQDTESRRASAWRLRMYRHEDSSWSSSWLKRMWLHLVRTAERRCIELSSPLVPLLSRQVIAPATTLR